MEIDIKKLDEPGVITTHILRNWDKEKIERFVRYFEGRVSSEVQPVVMPGGEDVDGTGWRRVEDELPKIEERVLIYHDYLLVGWYNHVSNKWESWRDNDVRDVKCWMPLPKPPEV